MNLESVDPHLVVGGEQTGRARAAHTAKHLYWGTEALSLTHGQARPAAGNGGQRSEVRFEAQRGRGEGNRYVYPNYFFTLEEGEEGIEYWLGCRLTEMLEWLAVHLYCS